MKEGPSTMLVSEALFLLLSDKSAHFEVGVSHQRVALNGALLCDLVATGLVLSLIHI